MKKLYTTIIMLLCMSAVFGQCLTTEDANNTPSSCKRGSAISTSDGRTPIASVKEADKWLTTIYNTVIDAAVNKTKGLKGTWSGSADINTAEGLIPYTFYSFLLELGCTKDQKLYTKDESGFLVTLRVNSLKDIAEECKHTEYKLVNNKTEEKQVFETVNGRQVYLLRQASETEKYAKFSFYKKDEKEKFIVIANPDIPLFIPVSIRDALAIIKGNYIAQQNYQMAQYDNTLNQSFESYLAAREFAAYEKKFGAEIAAKAKASHLSNYDSGQKDAKKWKEKNLYQQYINNIDTYLKQSSVVQLNKPCIAVGFSQLGEHPITSAFFLDNKENGMQYVTINPAYTNKSPGAPHFIIVETRLNALSGVTLTQKKIFEDNIDFKKLADLLVK